MLLTVILNVLFVWVKAIIDLVRDCTNARTHGARVGTHLSLTPTVPINEKAIIDLVRDCTNARTHGARVGTHLSLTPTVPINEFSVDSAFVSEKVTLLNDGNAMPSPALGTAMYDLNDRQYMPQAVIWAIEAGCRHIDAAAIYGSEDKIGEAIKNVTRRGIVKRTDMFVTTKLSPRCPTREQVISYIRDALTRLQLEYVDLYLIHSPRNVLNVKNRDYLEIWKGLEDAKRMGLTRSIGVSNFNATEINRILLNSKTPPAVNQIETNPTFTNLELVAYCQSKNIVVTGYSPFGFLVPRPYNNLTIPPTFDNPILVGMAEKYCVKVSQLLLRHLVERNIVPIAASFDKEHIESNIDIFDFTISPEDILIINDFDKNIKVHLMDYDGLEQEMLDAYWYLKRYAKANNLKQYKNV